MSFDRSLGAVLGMAVGDALGAGYEFSTPGPDARIEMRGGGPFGFDPGEWTDDTAMGIAVLDGCGTCPPDVTRIANGFLEWFRSGPKDVGGQTGSVLSAASTGEDLPAAAAAFHQRSPDRAGNGSLMRTAAVALACPGDPAAIATAARSVSDLTHRNQDCGDACVLWSIAIDNAITTGEFDVRIGLDHLNAEGRKHWTGLIDEAEYQPPATFTPNGWVVTAFQAAWSTITHTLVPADTPAAHLRHSLVEAVRIGNDTDTVAAITGMLLGARWGASAIPPEFADVVHGWPDLDREGLQNRVEMLLAAR